LAVLKFVIFLVLKIRILKLWLVEMFKKNFRRLQQEEEGYDLGGVSS